MPGLSPRRRQDKAQQAEVAEQLGAQCDWLEAQADSAGPFFMGGHFSLVDCALVPWFVRAYVLQHFRGLQLPPERCTKVPNQAPAMLLRGVLNLTFSSSASHCSSSMQCIMYPAEQLMLGLSLGLTGAGTLHAARKTCRSQHALPQTAGCLMDVACLPPQLHRWMVAALQRPSVGASFKSPEEGASYKVRKVDPGFRHMHLYAAPACLRTCMPEHQVPFSSGAQDKLLQHYERYADGTANSTSAAKFK